MTDGTWEKPAKDPQFNPKKIAISYGPTSDKTDQFSRAIAKIAVAQILEKADFCCSYRAPIETLAGVMLRFISHVGKLAVCRANLSGRFDCNVFDVIQALEEIESGFGGFLGQSDLNRCLGNSGVVKDLFGIVSTEKEIPFAREIPRFPILKDFEIPDLGEKSGIEKLGKHIPNWLPPFPDVKMYENFEGFELRQGEKRKKERPFFSLQKLFGSNGSNGSDEKETGTKTGTEKGKEVVQNNPYLVPAFLFGEKDVSQAGTAKISLINSFTPLIEDSKEKSEIEKEKVESFSEKPVIRFRIGDGKKSVVKDLWERNESVEKDLWFEKEDETDLKKIRAEFVLKESMETDL